MDDGNIFEIIRRNSIKKLKMALETGCDVTVRNERKETPLIACIMHLKEADCVKQMLDTGADVNDQNERGQTALIYSCILNKLDMISILLKQNDLDVNKTDSDGNTALMYACALGHKQAVLRLLEVHNVGEHSLDLKLKNNDGMSAVDHATDRGHLEIIKILSDASPEKKNEERPVLSENNWIEMKPITDHSPTGKTRQARRDKMQKVIDKVRKHSLVEGKELKLKIAPRPLEPTITVTAPGEDGHTLVTFDDETSPSFHQKRIPKSPTSAKKESVESDSGDCDLDYEDFSLESLGDLVKSFRQCAQEIREICAPLQSPIYLKPPKAERKRTEKKGKESAKLRAKNTAIKTDAILLDIPMDTPRARPQTLSDEEKNLGDVDVFSQTWPRHREDRVVEKAEIAVKRSVSMSPAQTAPKPRSSRTSGQQDKRLLGRMIDRLTNRKSKQNTAINMEQPSTSGLQEAKIQISSIEQNFSKSPLIREQSRDSKEGHDNAGYIVEVVKPTQKPLERY